jgi:folate-dependent phosphoribosylglycinamide formyltransferase PurN
MLKPEHPLRVAILSSRRTPGLSELLADPRRGRLWELAGVLATAEDFAGAAELERAGISLLTNPIRPFYAERGARITDRAARCDYDEKTVELLEILRPDLLLLSSYLYLLTTPMLAAYRGRIVNVHGSDLTRRGPSGLPRYGGLRAVAEAIFAGERETRATAHWVDEGMDTSRPILRSRPFPVSPMVESARACGDVRALKAYAFAHQEWMLREAWGPLSRGVLRLLAAGRISLGGRRAEAARVPMWDLSEQGALCLSNEAVRPLAYC